MTFCVLSVFFFFFFFAIRIFHAAALYLPVALLSIWDHSGLLFFFFNEYNWLCLYLKEKVCRTITKKKKKEKKKKLVSHSPVVFGTQANTFIFHFPPIFLLFIVIGKKQ